MILFADSSVLVKLYIAEPGSEKMREAAQRQQIAASGGDAQSAGHAPQRLPKAAYRSGRLFTVDGRLPSVANAFLP